MSGKYDWLTLDDDEEILWEGKISQKSMIGTYVVGVPLILLLGLGLLIIVPSYLIVKHTDYVITSKGVYKKTGILSRSVTEIEYEKIQNTAFSAGPVARYFGYGDVDISTAGGSGVEMKLRAVEDPQDVQKRLSRLVKRAQGARSEEESDGKADVLGDILVELRAIRQSVETSGADGPRETSGRADR
ncbi:PH domain-containing protein [Halobacteria archaeon HArc-gm2]|nr:PH domain-containing protein [Halobacteria archaeon HArc-gm2]